MRRRGNRTFGAQAQGIEDLVVFAAQHVDKAAVEQGEGVGKITAAILDGDDPLVGDDVEQGRLFEGHAGTVWDVVENQRYAGGIGDRAEKRFEAGLGRADVIRCRHQQASHRALEDLALELQQLGQVVTGQAHDHLLRRRQFQHRIEHRQLLMLAHRRRFAGGAANDETVDTFFQQMADQPAQADKIDGAVVEWCDQWNPDTLKR
ncbi:hypothetical protein D9M71_615400 [compost metagenome]